MENEYKFTIIATILGLIVGISISTFYSQQSTTSKCEKVENAVNNSSNFTGAIACFPPGVVDIDSSKTIENRTEVECVCRKSLDGTVQYWSINKVN